MSPTDSSTPPSREQLQGSLRDLHQELERSPRIDSESRRRLQALLAEVHHLLHGQRAADPRCRGWRRWRSSSRPSIPCSRVACVSSWSCAVGPASKNRGPRSLPAEAPGSRREGR